MADPENQQSQYALLLAAQPQSDSDSNFALDASLTQEFLCNITLPQTSPVVGNGCLQDDEDSLTDDTSSNDPFSPQCKIPLPNVYSYDYWLEPTFIRRRNERERQRVRNVNDGFERLRSHLPMDDSERERRLSKVETLRLAIGYIRHLEDMLKENNCRRDISKDNN